MIVVQNGITHLVRCLNDFRDIVSPEIFEALEELVQDKPKKKIDYEQMAEGLVR